MAKSKIEWTDEVWNPVTGCTKVSQGCKHCYAETIAGRFWATQYEPNEDGTPRKFTDVRVHPERLMEPLKWKKPRRVFVNSMSDLFHEEVPVQFIAKVFEVMAAWRLACRKKHEHEEGECYEDPGHIYQILTKRPERMLRVLRDELPQHVADFWPGDSVLSIAMEIGDWPLPNVWLGVSVEDQRAANERIPMLVDTPAAVRFVSCEPLLGQVDLTGIPVSTTNGNYALNALMGNVWRGKEEGFWTNKLDWVIVGGESGTDARPMDRVWLRGLRNQCLATSTALFVKQMGTVWAKQQGIPGKGEDWEYWPESYRIREFPITEGAEGR
jgi:protein gp37